MRILAVTNLYPRPGHEGRAAFNRQQLAALGRRHDLAVIAPVAWTDEARDLLRGRRTVRHRAGPDGFEVSHPRFVFPPRLLRSAYGHCFEASVGREFRRLVRDFRPEAVLACWAHPDGWAAVRLARRAGLPCVIKVVGSDVLVAARHGGRRARIVEALRGAAAVAAVGRDLAARVVALGVPAGRVVVVPEGLDPGRFGSGDQAAARERLGLPAAAPLVLFVGNLVVGKGAAVLIAAIAELHRRGHPARCVLVGGGPDAAALRATAGRLGVGDRVGLVGPIPHADLPTWYHAADVVALPSFSEGTPNVLREAAACGRPFVASNVGGIPEVAEGAAARLVPPGDAVALADALAEVLAWGPQAPARWMTWDESAARLADLIGRTLIQPPGGDALPTGPTAGCSTR